MSATEVVQNHSRVWRLAARTLLSTAASAALVFWLFFSTVLWAFRCDDTCSGDQAEGWRWTAQLVLAVVGCLFGGAGLVCGFRSKTRAQWLLLGMSLVCALVWCIWVIGSGSF